MTFKWESPDSVSRMRIGALAESAEKLKTKPGKWARIFEAPSASRQAAYSVVSTINAGTRAGFYPARSFEATSKTVAGKTLVYARYVGNGSL